jgi:hypothetical protein
MNEYIMLGLLSVLLFSCPLFNETMEITDVSLEDKTITWSPEVAELGEPTYETIDSGGYQILPFPGLTYRGIVTDYKQFTASNEEYQFAIYASPNIEKTDLDFNGVKNFYEDYYQISCNEFDSSNWLTKSRTFKCYYYDATYAAYYKIVVLYKPGEYVFTTLGVWGTDLGEYEYIYNEFCEKAIKWD